MTIDKYTKFILTLIAVGIIALNFNLVSPANAAWDTISDSVLRDIASALRDIANAIKGIN